MPTHGPHPAPPFASSRLAAFLYFGQLPCQRRSVPFECGDELHAQYIATSIKATAADSQPNAHRARNVRNELVVQMLFDNVLIPHVQYGPSRTHKLVLPAVIAPDLLDRVGLAALVLETDLMTGECNVHIAVPAGG